ncbi:hypothetical protein BDP27DRAFT_1412900 [Rhodocollybia butyracea]|uniref:Uncharacterized protein n=1 Tax=Rhodocollybia butyracea TaxID=206335 RepID=A0A9P5UG53_9AGAR|nr:hypothetical protein BDP27DRAFT_1412900 [Rhodocollybia butyracea]
MSTEASDVPIKKSKIRKPFDTRYETPHPSSFSESQFYTLPSSVGSYLSPSRFSPIPKVSTQRTHRRTSSTNLKENASVLHSPFPRSKQPQNLRKYGKSHRRKRTTPHKNLESPFNSCSSSASPTSSPDSHQLKRTLPNGKHNLNISRPASQSTTNSPTYQAKSHPNLSDWDYKPRHAVSALDLHVPISTDPDSRLDADLPPNMFLPAIRPSPNHSRIDFNRPPSQLSLYDYSRCAVFDDKMEIDEASDLNQDAFFSDVRCTSTPFKHLGSLSAEKRRFGGNVDPAALSGPALLQSFAGPDTDTDGEASDSDEELRHRKSFFQALKLASKNKSKIGSGYITPSDSSDDEFMRPRSPWISDSLISPPKTTDWRLPKRPEGGAYKQADNDVDMDKEEQFHHGELEGLFDNMMLNPALNAEETHSSPVQDTDSCCTRLPLRTRSLDTSLSPPPYTIEYEKPNSAAPLARRTRSGTIIPGTSSTAVSDTVHALPRRTRSGTVVPGNTKVFSPPPALTNDDGSAAHVPLLGRRTRSGTIVPTSMNLAPSLPIVEERIVGPGVAALPSMSRRVRSSNGKPPSSFLEGAANSQQSGIAPGARVRSGSFVALGNALVNLPSQAAGMMKRSRSGTVVPSAPGLDPAVEQVSGALNLPDSVMDDNSATIFSPQNENVDVQMSEPAQTSPGPGSPTDALESDDTLNLVDKPIVFSSSTHSPPPSSIAFITDINTAPNARSYGLRARAKAAATKAKGLGRTLAGKANARGKALTGPEAGPAAVARARARGATEDDLREEDLSDDELLLK